MIGKVTKEVLYKAGRIVPDLRAIKILATIPDRKDDTIMNAIVKELEDEGIEVMDQTLLIKPLLPPPGVLTKRKLRRQSLRIWNSALRWPKPSADWISVRPLL